MLSLPESSFIEKSQTLKIQAHLLRIKQIKEILEKHKTVKVLVIQCFELLIIDEDLSLPGVSVIIITKNRNVIGDRIIDLKGADG